MLIHAHTHTNRLILLNYPMLSHSFVVVNPLLITQSALADL